MTSVNPMQLLQMIKNGANPQQLMISILEKDDMAKTPFGANLLELAKNGQGADIEKIARNLCASKGVDFDKEFSTFKFNLGLQNKK